MLVTDGTFSDDGAFHPLETWDADAVMKLFRERRLARLVECHALSEELARKLLAWRHPGFSAHVGEAIPFEDKKASRRTTETSDIPAEPAPAKRRCSSLVGGC